jgi:hypothetical protein
MIPKPLSAWLSRFLPVRYPPSYHNVCKKTVGDPDIRARAG